MSVSAVTKTVARLEDEMGVQLFNRTTRRLNATEYGEEFYRRSAQILADLDEAEATLRDRSLTPRGRLKVVVPFSFGRVTLIPELPSFLARYPEISLDIDFSDKAVDIIAGGYDLAVWTGRISDSGLITRLLTRGPTVTVAAPKYIEKHGCPEVPADLKEHNCIVGRFGPEWQFKDTSGRLMSVVVSGNASFNSGDALREAAVAGLGIAQGTWWMMRKDLETGAVEAMLTNYACDGNPISVLYPSNRHMPRKVRVFIDFIIEITQSA